MHRHRPFLPGRPRPGAGRQRLCLRGGRPFRSAGTKTLPRRRVASAPYFLGRDVRAIYMDKRLTKALRASFAGVALTYVLLAASAVAGRRHERAPAVLSGPDGLLFELLRGRLQGAYPQRDSSCA